MARRRAEDPSPRGHLALGPRVKPYAFAPPCEYAMARLPWDWMGAAGPQYSVVQSVDLDNLVRANPDIPTSMQELDGKPFRFFAKGHGMPIRIPEYWPDPNPRSWLWEHVVGLDGRPFDQGVAYSPPFGI